MSDSRDSPGSRVYALVPPACAPLPGERSVSLWKHFKASRFIAPIYAALKSDPLSGMGNLLVHLVLLKPEISAFI